MAEETSERPELKAARQAAELPGTAAVVLGEWAESGEQGLRKAALVANVLGRCYREEVSEYLELTQLQALDETLWLLGFVTAGEMRETCREFISQLGKQRRDDPGRKLKRSEREQAERKSSVGTATTVSQALAGGKPDESWLQRRDEQRASQVRALAERAVALDVDEAAALLRPYPRFFQEEVVDLIASGEVSR